MTRHGAARVSAASTGLALLGAVLVVGAPSLWPALVGFGLIGVGGAVLYPLMVSAAARTPGRPPEESVAAVILLYGLAVLVTPVAMGAIAETWGLRAAFGAVVPTMLVTLALVRLSAPRG